MIIITSFFASEINPLFAAGVEKNTNEKVWSSFFSDGSYGLPNETFWQNINQLPGGYFLILKDNKLNLKKWYSFEQRTKSLLDRFHDNEEEYITNLLFKSRQFPIQG